ncbi:MAG: DNA adenine methylase [Pseudomonadota bacterium]
MTHVADVPRPVLKWAGGKRQLLSEILQRLPAHMATYYEPFVGGGAVFFALAARGAFRRAVLSDTNAELINLYTALKEDVGGVIRALEKLRDGHSTEQYYRVRASVPKSETARAARLIYLNRTGFNGLYRVNSKGEFNVPIGRYARPRILDERRLRAAAEALATAEIVLQDFETVCARARRGDAVYFDPPYLPVSRTASFAEYQATPFDLPEHERLARVFTRLAARGVACLLSNSDTKQTRELFANHRVEFVSANRAINSVASRRGAIREILVSPALDHSTPERRRTAAARRPSG